METNNKLEMEKKMETKLVNVTDLKGTEHMTMHDGKCVFQNNTERELVLFEHSYTSVMTTCCNFETGRTSTDLFENTNGWTNPFGGC